MRHLRLVLVGLVASGALLVLLGQPEASGAIQAEPEVPLVTVTVTKTDDTADGACDADCSLREAIIALKPSIPPSPIGTIILRQCGTHHHAGRNVGRGRDDTLFALKDGGVRFRGRKVDVVVAPN